MVGCAILGNYCGDPGGGISIHISGNGNFLNCTFNGNRSDDEGAAIHRDGTPGSLELTNSILWNNTSTSTNQYTSIQSGSVSVSNCLIQGVNGHVNPNLSNGVNPAHAPVVGGEPRPHFESSAVDSALQAVTVPETDLTGWPRRHGRGLDIGAYEALAVIYVGNVNELPLDPPPPGSSWINPHGNLQTALAEATPSRHIIFVAEGVYFPDEGTNQSNNNRNSSFVLLDDVPVYGGFAIGDSALADRDPYANPTILSGDIDKNDVTTDGQTMSTEDIVGNNSYRVVSANLGDYILDGFIITGGKAGSGLTANGAGFLCSDASLNLTRTRFIGNVASTGAGGGLHLDQVNLTAQALTFLGNRSATGGALFATDSSVSLINGLFAGNKSTGHGGAIYNDGSTFNLVNGTLANNASVTGLGAGCYSTGASTNFTNSLLWSNRNEDYVGTPDASLSVEGPASYTNCLMEGVDLSLQGNGNLDGSDFANDPQFISFPDSSQPGGGDFRLKGASPAINMGQSSSNSTGTDVAGGPRKIGVIDIGGYEMLQITGPPNYTLIEGDGPGYGNVFDLDSVIPGADTYTLVSNSNPGFFTASIDSNNAVDITLVNANQTGSVRLVFIGTTDESIGYYEVTISLAGDVLFVDDTALGGNNGSSWADAYLSLQDALAVAVSGQEIWVAEGVYYPDDGSTVTDGNRSTSFAIPSGVTVYGGFSGLENTVDARDLASHFSILSGDIDQDDSGTDGLARHWNQIVGNNSYQVVTATNTATLDGVVITAGLANGASPLNFGAAVYGNPTLVRCTFIGNRANQGGGVYAPESIEIDSCNFISNTAGRGGGLYLFEGDSNPVNCRFAGNNANLGGGAYGHYTDSTFVNCAFTGNRAGSRGGGASIAADAGASASFVNCTFGGNHAKYRGGGLRTSAFTKTHLKNCVFLNNESDDSNYQRGNIYKETYSLIDWDGIRLVWSKNKWQTYTERIYAIPETLASGNADQFVEAFSPDLAPTALGDYRLAAGSAALDEGENNFYDASYPNEDAAGVTRIQGTTIDRGAYETGYPTTTTSSSSLVYFLGETDASQEAVFDLSDVLGQSYSGFTLGSNSNSSFVTPTVSPGGIVDLLLKNIDEPGSATLMFTAFDGFQASAHFIEIHLIPRIMYVDPAASGSESGLDWDNAYPNPQEALAAAVPGTGQEIWVAGGVYYPDEGTGQSDNDRASTFQIAPGISLFGGFTGGETSLDQRDPAMNVTILSGDIDQDDLKTDDVVLSARDLGPGNAYSVVTIEDESRTALGLPTVINGFTITGGNATPPSGTDFLESLGGGVHTNDLGTSLLQIRDCRIVGNAAYWGGGIFTNLTDLDLINTSLRGNESSERGGGAFFLLGQVDMTNCLIAGNVSGTEGGGIYNNRATLRVYGCTVTGNTAVDDGAGLSIQHQTPRTNYFNTIVWNNRKGSTPSSLGGFANDPRFFHCLVEGYFNLLGEDNFDGSLPANDPLFVTPITTGAPTAAGDLRLGAGSPMIDMGEDTYNTEIYDFAGRARISGSAIDLGCYENDSIPPVIVINGEASVGLSLGQAYTELGATATDESEGILSVVIGGDTVDENQEGFYEITYTASDSSGNGAVATRLVYIGVVSRLYVNSAAATGGDGKTWPTAFTSLADALDRTFAGFNQEVWVAAGVYVPDHGELRTDDDREATFQLSDGVTLHGGFGGHETNIADRNLATNVTILTGDLQEDDVDADGNKIAESVSDIAGDNAFTVVTVREGAQNVILDSVTITAGLANQRAEMNSSNFAEDATGKGAGLYGKSTILSVSNCRFTGNEAGHDGGLHLTDSTLTCTETVIENNEARTGGGITLVNSSATMENCKVIDNYAEFAAGFAAIDGSTGTMVNTALSGNFAALAGGAGYLDAGEFHFTNCLLTGNRSGQSAILHLANSPGLFFTNCTLAYNLGNSLIGDFNSPAPIAILEFTDSIIWQNTGFIHHADQSKVTATGTNINGSSNPQFIQGLSLSLSTIPDSGGDFRLQDTSPMIDAGVSTQNTTTVDLARNPRVQGGTIDRGPYETTPPVTPYETWIARFYPGETDPTIVGMSADPNHDGLANVLAFILGGSPIAHELDKLPVKSLDDQYFITVFPRRADAAYLNPYLMFSTDLKNWSIAVNGQDGVIIEVEEDGFGQDATGVGIDKVTVKIPWAGHTGLFYRLTVEP